MIAGERQMASVMEHIKPDHRARYIFASSYIRPGDAVLDAICGIGYGSKLMAQLSTANIVGFDRDEEAVQMGKRYYSSPNVTFIQSSYEEFMFPQASFDVVTCFEAIEHVQDAGGLLLKLNLLLKHRGLLLISTPNQAALPWSKEKFPEHVRHYDKDQIARRLTHAGFNVESWHCQRNKYSFKIDDGCEGNFMIAVCRKQ